MATLSYHGIVGYGKATLPSVEAGLGSMNILKDPNRGVFTRQKTRVGDTNQLTEWIDESGDRSCEAILEFPRGINPMVGVSYQNYGNNGGQRSGGIKGQCISMANPRLPYALGAGGFNFRPPVLRQENLMPLSRLPRAWTNVNTNKASADFTKKLACPQPAELTKQVHSQTLKTAARPTCTYKLEQPIHEPFEVKYVIQNPVKVSAESGFKERQFVQHEVIEPYSHITDNPLHSFASTQIGSDATVRQIDNSELDTEKYTHQTHHADVKSNAFDRRDVTPISDFIDVEPHIQEKINVQYDSRKTHSSTQDYIHDEMKFQRKLPNHSAGTNQGQNIHRNIIEDPYQKQYERNRPQVEVVSQLGSKHTPRENMHNNSRDARLLQKVQPGGFHGGANIPTFGRADMNANLPTLKQNLNSRANENHEGRFQHGATHAPRTQAVYM